MTEDRVRDARSRISWLRKHAGLATRAEIVQIDSLARRIRLAERQRPTAPGPVPTTTPRQPAREVRPLDISTISIGPDSDRYFLDPTSSK